MEENEDKNKKVYDLEERTAKLGENIINFCKKIHLTPVNTPIINQLVGSGTSVGLNYCEADCAESRKDFEHKLGISHKETKESKHWLRMISISNPEVGTKARILWKESNELQLIFRSIIKKSKAHE
ncbi:MAG: four helix bundle protein [Candidatus Paceibacterota bacterium]